MELLNSELEALRRLSFSPASVRRFLAENEESNRLVPLGDAIEEALNTLPIRSKILISHRFGLTDGCIRTLEETGRELGITRERVRQVENQTLRRLWHHFRSRTLRTLLRLFVKDLVANGCRLVVEGNSLRSRQWLLLDKIFAISHLEIRDLNLVVLGASSNDDELANFWSHVPRTPDATELSEYLSQRSFGLVQDDILLLGQKIATYARRHLSKSERVYHVLKLLDKPSHFTTIAAAYNEVFPEDKASTHSIHAILGRETQGIVWVGLRGTFALREWGYERPALGFFDAVTTIVIDKYAEIGKPVPLNVIRAELPQYRDIIKETSLIFATYTNERLRQVGKAAFVPKQPSEEPEEVRISDDELDLVLKQFRESRGKP